MAGAKGPSLQSWLTWNLSALGLLVVALVRHGFPLDAWTWGVLLSLAILPAVAAAFRRAWLRKWLCTSALLGCAYVAFPEFSLLTPLGKIERWGDSRGGRVGVTFHPHLRFGKDGLNTALL